jgi:hypothetical protein
LWEEKKKQVHDGGLDKSHSQAPLPPNLLKEKDAAQPGRHLHEARDCLTKLNAHSSKFCHLEAQGNIAVTDGKPGTEREREREREKRIRTEVKKKRGGVGMEEKNKHRDLEDLALGLTSLAA